MTYPIEIKEKAIKLRKKGYSIKEISTMLYIAQSTSSKWLSPIILNNHARQILKEKNILGQYKANEARKMKKHNLKQKIDIETQNTLSRITLNKELYKLLCAIFFWTEGGKYTDSYVYFTNSDPQMIATFLTLFRSSFTIQENKLRALVHVHEYHNEKDIVEFWSKITRFSTSQFSKSYLKPHTKKRIRIGYNGSIRIRYYDYKVALELRALYNNFVKMI